MLDILWLVGPHKNNVVTESSKELFWEDTFRNIIPDGNIRKVFLKIIYNNLTDNECIIYRQDIIKDFLDNRQLMEDILSFIEKADVFCDEYNNAIKTTKNILNDTRNSETLSGAISSLQITSFFFKRITHLILKLKESFSLYNIKSYGLLSIKTRLAELEDKIYNTQVINIISDLENIHIDETNASFYLHLNENGRIGEINLNNVYSSFLNDKKTVTRLFKRKRNIQFSANVRYSEETNKIISQEILNISDIIYDITRSIIIEFGALKNGICFYKGGIQYIDYLIGKKIPLCFPTFSPGTKIEGLYDLNLISRNLTNIVPNDFEFDEYLKGCLIKGPNSSGKTVYMRSIAVSFFIAQSGLPVPAKRAQYSIAEKIYSLYSHSETSDSMTPVMGRFECEVKELSDIVFSAKPNSMIIFNEMFQTTKYGEGAEGLFHIFNYLSHKNIRWIAVTHIEELFSLYKDDISVEKILIEKYHALNYK